MSPEAEPATAEELMRSRFAAFKSGDAAWLLRTWHPSTRPASLDLADSLVWRGLQIIDTDGGGPADTEGVVEFRATHLDPEGNLGILHERSRFLREGDSWFYLDGEIRD